jgi:D-glycero-alpha-D-manno-heptose-7-phosphate kinase
MDQWLGLELDSHETARLAFDVERNRLGIPGGRQDQYAATFGGFNFLEFVDGETTVTPLSLSKEWIAELEYAIVLAYTGVSRHSAEIIADQIRNFERRKADAVGAMDETKRLASEMRRALSQGNFEMVGHLLDTAWTVKKRMSRRISNEAIDRLYSAAMDAGALGGKISGAGGGGFAFFFAAFDSRGDVIQALKREGADVVDFGFTEEGLQSWTR